MAELYWYRAVVTRVIDGDTIEVNMDLGFKVHHILTVRLLGVNTPELVGPERAKALEAKAAVVALVEGKEITVQTHKDGHDRYGRYLASAWFREGKELRSLGEVLISRGLAVAYMT